MKIRPTTSIETSVSVSLAEELEASINAKVRAKWNKKIEEGIVPTEVKLRGKVNLSLHWDEMRRLDIFISLMVNLCFEKKWKHAIHKTPKFIHFFGVGTGGAIEPVARTANSHGYGVRTYDTCDTSYLNAEQAFAMIKESPDRIWRNENFYADIEFACDPKYIEPAHSAAIVIPRVLDILDKQEVGWMKTRRKNRKMPRVARKLGVLVDAGVDVLLVHPCPEDNVDAVWGDTTPHPLDEVLGYIQEGSRNKIRATKPGTVIHHGHKYTAVLIERA
jgi:hypothetical protein